MKMEARRRVKVGGHELSCESAGRGASHFTCLHGLADSLAIWDALMPLLSQRGRATRVDQRGHGESDAPPGPYRRDDLAQDVVRLLDALEIERSVLVGHSMGGIVAMATALAFPDRVAGLVLLGTASQCNERTAGWYERIARAGESEGPAGLARAIYGEKSKKEILGDAQGIAHVTRMLKSLFDDPLTPKLASLTCPTLLLVGEKDPMGPRASEIVHASLPPGRGTLEILPGRGHWLHVEAPDRVIDALDRWLARERIGA